MSRHEEHQIQKAICNLLHYQLPADATFWAVPNGGTRKLTTLKNGKKVSLEGRRLKDEGVKAGVADLMILWRGKLICLEVKTDKGRQSPSQKEWALTITQCGGLYHVVRSVDDVKAILDVIGCHKPRAATPALHNDIDDWLAGRSSTEAKAGHQGNKGASAPEYSGAK